MMNLPLFLGLRALLKYQALPSVHLVHVVQLCLGHRAILCLPTRYQKHISFRSYQCSGVFMKNFPSFSAFQETNTILWYTIAFIL